MGQVGTRKIFYNDASWEMLSQIDSVGDLLQTPDTGQDTKEEKGKKEPSSVLTPRLG